MAREEKFQEWSKREEKAQAFLVKYCYTENPKIIEGDFPPSCLIQEYYPEKYDEFLIYTQTDKKTTNT